MTPHPQGFRRDAKDKIPLVIADGKTLKDGSARSPEPVLLLKQAGCANRTASPPYREPDTQAIYKNVKHRRTGNAVS
jgi:hypothetical protein